MVEWPPYSPDLNPIETVWDWMKDWIDDRYEGIKLTYPQLRKAVNEAWEAVSADYLGQLLDEMPARCQAVINAKGKIPKY